MYNGSNDEVQTINVSNNGTGSYFYNATFIGLTKSKYFLNATHFNLANTTTNSTTLTFSTAILNISVLDELTESFLPDTEEINLLFVGDSFSVNLSSNTSTFGVVGWVSGEEYRITYRSGKYTQRDHYITLNNVTNVSLDLYLLSITNGTDVTFSIEDTTGTRLADATIFLKRYFISTNSYRTVAMSKTNAVGQTIFDVDFNDAFYETLTTFGGFSLSTIGAKFISTTIRLNINLLQDVFSDLDTIDGVTTSISFNNVSQTFSYTFTDNNGLSRTGLLEVKRVSASEEVLVCSSTDTSSSATLLCGVNTTLSNSTHVARGFIVLPSGNKLMETIQEGKSIVTDLRSQIFQTQGDFFAVILGGTLAGLGLAVSPTVGIIMFLVGMSFINFFGFAIIESVMFGTFVILGGLLIWKLKS